MKRLNSGVILLILVIMLFHSCTKSPYPAQTLTFTGHQATGLSQNSWKLWPDSTASWENDSLFLPPVNLNQLAVNEPTCGWDNLPQKGIAVNLPATVEEYFWGQYGNPFGQSGNYTGVSWFTTTFIVPEEEDIKHIFLDFESARLRAEVYVNRKLAGYDIITGTPFSVDITDFVITGKPNELAVRITDPNGNLTWRDYRTYPWGKYEIPASHGFGGITGKVYLRTSGNSYLKDVFVKNKPAINEIDLEVSLNNDKAVSGDLKITITDPKKTEPVLDTVFSEDLPPGSNSLTYSLKVKDVRQWSVNTPELYTLQVAWTAGDGSNDLITKKIGFRWFEVKERDGDKQFYLNNQRIVLRSAISWGFWPVNGIYPTDELAEKQIRTAKDLGLNMLNFHRAIGQPKILDLADEMGLLYYEEPGGYGHGNSDFAREFNRIKLFRMIKRDRSHPGLVIYSQLNEAGRDPEPHELEDLKKAHQLDETRCITFSSQYYPKHYRDGITPKTPSPGKAYMLPYEHEIRYQGWWDRHHAGGPGVYPDERYNSPSDYYLYTNHKEEIIFWGEEGAIGTPPRLSTIKDDLQKTGKSGWDGNDFIDMHDAYEQFIYEKGFNEAFPVVDSLTKSLGNVSMYYQGRMIENFRINNIGDGYVVNGWEEMKFENHSGIVDIYRNPKGDPKILARYNQPLYIAIKASSKVFELGGQNRVDLYVVNEKNLMGDFELKLTVTDLSGEILNKSWPVHVNGGFEYGQLLVDSLIITPAERGYCTLKASLYKEEVLFAEGQELLFTVQNFPETFSENLAVIDTSDSWINILKSMNIRNLVKYTSPNVPKERICLLNFVPEGMKNRMGDVRQEIFDWVVNGNTLIILQNTEEWVRILNEKEIVDTRGYEKGYPLWYGTNYFVKDHPLFNELPVNTAFNWEYQCLANYDRQRIGFRINGGETVVGLQIDHKKELYNAVVIIPVGSGRIILSTLDLKGALLKNDKPSVVARKILLNFLLYAQENE